MRLRTTIVILLLIFGYNANAQDPQFSQYYAAPLLLNPAFTGATNSHRVVVNNRIQWPNLPQAYNTVAVSYDMYQPDLRSGFGFVAMTDKAGSAGLRTTSAQAFYSYKVSMPNKWVMSAGIGFGFSNVGIDRSLLELPDQTDFGRGVTSLDPTLARIATDFNFDFAAGLLMYTANTWIGGSVYHLNMPNQSLIDLEARLPIKYMIHGGARIQIYDGPMHRNKVSHLTPSFVFKKQGSFNQVDLGLHYHVDPVMIGFWYRGIPLLKNFIGNPSHEALVFTMGLQFQNFEFGYSYDFTVSELSTSSGGAHEASLIYQFDLVAKGRKVEKKYQVLPCPTFNTIKKSGAIPFRKNY